jgi:hypothetical protein
MQPNMCKQLRGKRAHWSEWFRRWLLLAQGKSLIAKARRRSQALEQESPIVGARTR